MQYDDVTTNPIWRTAFGYISVIYRSINAKFGMLKHNHVQAQVKWPN